jgi:hypothetical protein
MSGRFVTLESLAQQAGATSALIEQLLNSPLLSASDSGTFGSHSSVESLEVGDKLQVLGHTTLSNLGVTGNITAGVLTIDGLEGSVNTVGQPLRLQNLGVAGIDILNGRITVDIDGNLRSKGQITVKKLNIDEAGKSIGDAVIPAGQLSVDVPTTVLTSRSRVFVTSENPAAIGARKLTDTKFRIELKSALDEDIKVNWWIVN